jgi:hypothetical protein
MRHRGEYDKESSFKPIHVDEYVDWYEDIATNIYANLENDGSYFCNIKPNAEGIKRELYVFDLVLAHVRKWQWNYADEFCWERAGIPQQVARRFKNQFEPIYHFTKGEWKFNPDAVKHESKAVPKAKGRALAIPVQRNAKDLCLLLTVMMQQQEWRILAIDCQPFNLKL